MFLEFDKYFEEDIENITRLNHEGNNQLYKISLPGQKHFLLKRYSTTQRDGWDRGKTEFEGISYFWNVGFRDVPEPIGFYQKENVAIYSFEEGEVLRPWEVGEKNIVQAADFLAKIHNLGPEHKRNFPLERTSCLSGLSYIELIKDRIRTIDEDFIGDEKARSFFYEVVCPKVCELEELIVLQTRNRNLAKELSLEEQVTTPGDFGFHNILVTPQKHTFLDFEYCGRDDPAKQVLDFLHHDKTRDISRGLKELFLQEYKKRVSSSPDFEERLRMFDPVIGMNWVLIYLNPLSRTYLQHLQFSHQQQDPKHFERLVEERIEKAQSKLNRLKYFSDF